jgi:hypothetical protein
MSHYKGASASSTSSSPLLPALFSPVQRDSIDSGLESPEAPSSRPFPHTTRVISELADCASSLITFFWLSHDYSAAHSGPRLPRRGSALPRFAQFLHHVLSTSKFSRGGVPTCA